MIERKSTICDDWSHKFIMQKNQKTPYNRYWCFSLCLGNDHHFNLAFDSSFQGIIIVLCINLHGPTHTTSSSFTFAEWNEVIKVIVHLELQGFRLSCRLRLIEGTRKVLVVAASMATVWQRNPREIHVAIAVIGELSRPAAISKRCTIRLQQKPFV